eukprot:COSAG03_NODE_1377_length_4212_cov_82.121080_4_plen_69_part_00
MNVNASVMQTKCIDEGVTQEVHSEGLIRPCVDCGRRTGSFCDAGDVVAGVCHLALPTGGSLGGQVTPR